MTRGTYGRMYRIYYGRNGMKEKNPTSFFKKNEKEGLTGVVTCVIL